MGQWENSKIFVVPVTERNWTGGYEIKSGSFLSKSNFIASAGLTPMLSG